MQFEKLMKRSETFLIGLGLIKMTFLALFFASFGFVEIETAHAQTAESCVGDNLLEWLKVEDPSLHDQVLTEAAAVINSRAIFWKLEKDGEKPSWLYGTMHMADPDISTIPADAKEAILASETLIIESVEALDQQAMMKAMSSLAHLTLLKTGTLRDLVEDDLEDELAVEVEKRGIPMQLADRMQPWLIATTVALPVCEMQRKQNGEKVLDNALAEFAVEHGKDLRGLETVSEQLTAMASLPVDYHVSALEETLASGSLALDMIETMKGLYKRGEMGYVFPLMKAVMPKAGSSTGTAKFQEALIDKRNQTMLDRSLPMIEEGPVFIAVGALHLPGEAGLVKLFRDAGYTVTPQR